MGHKEYFYNRFNNNMMDCLRMQPKTTHSTPLRLKTNHRPVPANLLRCPLHVTVSRRVRCGNALHRTRTRTRICAHNDVDVRVMMHLLPGSPPLLTSLSTPDGLRLAGHISYALLFIALSIGFGMSSVERTNKSCDTAVAAKTHTDTRSTSERSDAADC